MFTESDFSIVSIPRMLNWYVEHLNNLMHYLKDKLS